MFQFDEWGYITPPEVHELTLEDFERTFVIDSARERLFGRLLDLVSAVKGLGATEFYLWVDGSFVTKKRVPRDIDVVCFLDYKIFKKVEDQKSRLREYYKDYLDVFIEEDFPEIHLKYPQTVRVHMDWREMFGYDRNNRRKGFIQLQF